MAKKPGRMSRLGDKTVERTNSELSSEESEILLKTQIDWESLEPEITSQEIYTELIEVIQNATQNNESAAKLKSRIESIGDEAISLAKKIIEFIP